MKNIQKLRKLFSKMKLPNTKYLEYKTKVYRMKNEGRSHLSINENFDHAMFDSTPFYFIVAS